MLTIESLRGWGANVDEALVRCLNNESFYLMLVNKAMQDAPFDKLKEAVETSDLDKGFAFAHSIKGMAANLALTPICKPIEQITELLRHRTEMDYAPLLEEIEEKRRQLMGLLKQKNARIINGPKPARGSRTTAAPGRLWPSCKLLKMIRIG